MPICSASDGLAGVGLGGAAGDDLDEGVRGGHAREGVSESFRHALGELVLTGVAGEVREGQHHDGDSARIRLDPPGRSKMPDSRRDRGERDNQGRQSDDHGPLSSSGAHDWFRPSRRAGLERINVHGLGDILQPGRAEVHDGRGRAVP